MAAVAMEIFGRVQGVGFRAFVCRRAGLFGVSGKVWNVADGRVGVIAVHPELAVLEAFRDALSTGPGRVEGVEATEVLEPVPAPDGFSIAPTV